MKNKAGENLATGLAKGSRNQRRDKAKIIAAMTLFHPPNKTIPANHITRAKILKRISPLQARQLIFQVLRACSLLAVQKMAEIDVMISNKPPSALEFCRGWEVLFRIMKKDALAEKNMALVYMPANIAPHK